MDERTLIALIKKKPELKGVADEFVMSLIKKEQAKHRLPVNLSKKEVKLFVQSIRAQLRLHVGRFQPRGVSRARDSTSHHLSTHERAPHYAFLKELVQEVHPRSILDLGCGRNPLELATKDVTYYACDINEDDVKAVRAFFQARHISGEAFVADVATKKEFPAADLVLMLKLLDIIETKGHKRAEWLITQVQYKHAIVSFPTVKISGRRMNRPRRIWFEKMLARLDYPYTVRETENELFYCIAKPR